MSSLSRVESGKSRGNLFLTIYGVPGIGKSTFAANFPSPIFLCTEDGAKEIGVERLSVTKSADLKEYLQDLSQDEHTYKTVVIDSLDHYETILHREIAAANKVKSIGDMAYGTGYAKALAEWNSTLLSLSALKTKMNVILIAHSQIKTVNDPTAPLPYDRYSLKLHAKAADLVIEISDAVLFLNYETIVEERSANKGRAIGDGARKLYASHAPGHIAKNRYGLPYAMDLEYSEFQKYMKSTDNSENERKEIESLIPQIKNEEFRGKALAYYESNKFNTHLYPKIKARVMELLK